MSTADDTLSLISQPLYYGPASFTAVPKGSLSAEHFLHRVEELQLKFLWSPKRTLSMAMSFMRGPARDYFHHQAKMTLAIEEYADITTNPGRSFVAHFKESFFTLRSKKDINLSWSTLQQHSNVENGPTIFSIGCARP